MTYCIVCEELLELLLHELWSVIRYQLVGDAILCKQLSECNDGSCCYSSGHDDDILLGVLVHHYQEQFSKE